MPTSPFAAGLDPAVKCSGHQISPMCYAWGIAGLGPHSVRASRVFTGSARDRCVSGLALPRAGSAGCGRRRRMRCLRPPTADGIRPRAPTASRSWTPLQAISDAGGGTGRDSVHDILQVHGAVPGACAHSQTQIDPACAKPARIGGSEDRKSRKGWLLQAAGKQSALATCSRSANRRREAS